MITPTEKQVQIAAKLYDARSTMRSLLGDKYPERIKEYKGFIRSAMQKYKIDYLQATLRIGKELQALPDDTSVGQGMIFAACVEISEEK